MKTLSKQRAIVEVLFATSLWGFGFIATIWALQSFTTPELLILRFLFAFIIGKFIFSIGKWNKAQVTYWQHDFKLSLVGGFFLAATLILQTIGLQYTTATKSGFLTSLYVILIPIINQFIFKMKTHFRIYMLAVLACAGAWLLMNVGKAQLNPGDLWTLACAIMASLHIIYLARVSKKIESPFLFNNFQNMWCLIFTIPLVFRQESINLTVGSPLAWAGILSVAVGSSVIAFLIQIRTQKILSVTTASMLFLLESPFAFLYSALLLHERLEPTQLVGAGVILLASYLAVRWD